MSDSDVEKEPQKIDISNLDNSALQEVLTVTDDSGKRTFDLFQIFIKPISEMTDEELETTYEDLRRTRHVKFSTAKKKSALDLALDKMTPELAQQLLQKLAVQEAKEAHDKAEIKTETEIEIEDIDDTESFNPDSLPTDDEEEYELDDSD